MVLLVYLSSRLHILILSKIIYLRLRNTSTVCYRKHTYFHSLVQKRIKPKIKSISEAYRAFSSILLSLPHRELYVLLKKEHTH